MILLERLKTPKSECVTHCSPADSVSSAEESESSRNKKMPLWPMRAWC